MSWPSRRTGFLVAAFGAATVAATIVFGEVALRLFVPRLSLDYGGAAFSERYHHVSPQFRDRLEVLSRADDLFTVAIIGDSFVEGYGVAESDRFTTVLQERFGRAAAGNVRIVNLGHVSYSTIIYERLFRDVLPTLAPDLVIICLDQTDPVDDAIYRQDLSRAGDVDAPFAHTLLQELSAHSLQFWLYSHSRLFLLVEQASARYAGRSLLPASLAAKMAERNELKLRQYVATCQSPESTGEYFAVQRTYLERIDRAARGRVPVVFATYPRAEHLAWQPKTTLIAGAIPDRASSAVYSEYWLRRTGIEPQLTSSRFLHTAGAFRRASREGSIMYFHQGDTHWNATGHRLFADVLYPVILDYAQRAGLRSS